MKIKDLLAIFSKEDPETPVYIEMTGGISFSPSKFHFHHEYHPVLKQEEFWIDLRDKHERKCRRAARL